MHSKIHINIESRPKDLGGFLLGGEMFPNPNNKNKFSVFLQLSSLDY